MLVPCQVKLSVFSYLSGRSFFDSIEEKLMQQSGNYTKSNAESYRDELSCDLRLIFQFGSFILSCESTNFALN